MRSILERRVYAVVATQNDDGTAHVAPVMFLYVDGRITFETGAATRKARNIAARGEATALIQVPEAAWVAGLRTGHDRRGRRRIRASGPDPEQVPHRRRS